MPQSNAGPVASISNINHCNSVQRIYSFLKSHVGTCGNCFHKTSEAVRCLALIDELTPKGVSILSHNQEIRTFRLKRGHMADDFKVGLPFMGFKSPIPEPRRWEIIGLASAAAGTSVGLLGMGHQWAPDSVGTFVIMFDAMGASRLQSIAAEGYPLALDGAGQGEVIVFRVKPSGKDGKKDRTLAQWIKVAGMGPP